MLRWSEKNGKGIEYSESSVIYDPFGKEIPPNSSYKNIKFYDIEFNLTKEARKTFKSLSVTKLKPYLANISNQNNGMIGEC